MCGFNARSLGQSVSGCPRGRIEHIQRRQTENRARAKTGRTKSEQ